MNESGPNPLERAVVAVLKPLVRLAIKRSVAVGDMVHLLKRAYLEVVREDFRVPGRKLSISRVAVLTGLTRREVKRLMDELDAPGTESPRKQFNRSARVFGAWIADPAYKDKRGHPASLHFEAEDGVDFSTLVRTHGADVPARAILDELLRVGAVGYTRDGRIRPLARAYVPQTDEAAKLAILGEDVSDLISTIDHNLAPDAEELYFQRKVTYDNLPPDYLPKLRALVRKEGQKLLERLNRDMSKRDRDVQGSDRADASQSRSRAMIGVYYFEEDGDEAE